MSKQEIWKYGQFIFIWMQIILFIALGIVICIPFFLTGVIDIGIVLMIIILSIGLIWISILKSKFIKNLKS
jgi:hypothetical protein